MPANPASTHCGRRRPGRAYVLAAATLLGLGLGNTSASRAQGLVQSLAAPGARLMLVGDMDLDGTNEIVTLHDDTYPATVHVFRRYNDFWLDSESYELPNLDREGMPIQLVPNLGPAGGRLSILYVTYGNDPFAPWGLSVLRNLGPGPLVDAGIVGGLDRRPKLPASISTIGASPSGPGWTLIAAAQGGSATSGIYTFQGLQAWPADFELAPGFFPLQMITDYFSNDGFPDQVQMGTIPAGPSSNQLAGQVRYGQFGGGFGPWTLIGGVADNEQPLRALDWGGDGLPDLLTSGHYYGNSVLTLHPNTGTELGLGLGPISNFLRDDLRAIPCDLDGDGVLEVVSLSYLLGPSTEVSEVLDTGITVWRQNFPPYVEEENLYLVGPATPAPNARFDLAVDQLDGDLNLDVAFLAEGVITIYPGLGDRTFNVAGAPAPRSARIPLGSDPARVLEVGEVTLANGRPELLVGFESATASLRAFTSTLGLNFTEIGSADAGPAVTHLAADPSLGGVAVGRGAEAPAWVPWDSGVPGFGAAFELAPLDSAGGQGEMRGLAISDVSNDGFGDLVCLTPGLLGDRLEFYLSDGAGGFLSPVADNLYPWFTGVVGLQFGNFTGAPYRELLTLNTDVAGVQHLAEISASGYSYNAESAGLGIAPRIDSPHPFAVAKFRGPQGPYDIVTTDETGFGARMLLMAGVISPYFADGPLYPTAGMPVAFAAGDLDGDGQQDFAVACRDPDAVTVYRNDGSGGFVRQDIVLGPGSEMQDVRIADVDGDGQADLVFLMSNGLIVPASGDVAKDGGAGTSSAMYVFSFPAVYASGVPGTRPDLPATARAELLPNSPNPFNPLTEIAFRLSRDAHAVLRVFDTRGRLVTTLVDGDLAAGEHRVRFDGRGLASGMYLGRLEADGVVQTRKMMLVR
jgi:hypothetical protein